MRNPVRPSSCVTPAGTSNELDVQNKWEDGTQHIHTRYIKDSKPSVVCNISQSNHLKWVLEGFNDWGGWGYDDFVPGEVIKTAPYGNRTT